MRHRQHEDEAFDKRGLLRDGQRLRVAMSMMDSLDPIQKAVAHDGIRVTDGQGGSIGLHRPGFRITANDARTTHYQPRDKAYEDYQRDLVDAYKTPVGFGGDPTITGFGERGSVGQRAGDVCTIDGKAGHLKMVNGALQCVPNRADAADSRQATYDAYDADLREAWRGC
jgi:hypothetical protein